MEGQSHPTYFDRYLDHAIVSRPHYAPHYPHLAALKKELQSWFFHYFEPRERMRAPTSVKEVRHIGSMGEELPAFLNTLNSLDPRQFLSEGTLRALGLLALSGVKEPPAVVGFEEPENGVHPRRIRDIAKILESRAESGNTQLIVTTHSPILPDHIANESLFVCQKKSTGTIIEPFSVWGPLARRSGIDYAPEEEAEPVPVSQRMLRGDFDA